MQKLMISAVIAVAASLSNLSPKAFAAGESGTNAGPVDFTVDCSKQLQVIRGFGSCLKGWGQPDKDPPAKWQMDPKGIEMYAKDGGFAVARMAVDRGVFGDSSKIPDDPSKISYEDFKWETGKAGENGKIPRGIRWFQELKKFNPNMTFAASVWSPPHWMKEGAKQSKGNSCGGSLLPKYYKHYAYFLAQYCLAMDKKFGVPLYAISLQNELSFTEPYDSCVYTPKQYHELIAAVGPVFKELGVKTKIMGPEDMTKFPDRLWGFVKPVLADSKTKDFLEIICSHGYSDGIQISGGTAEALKLWDLMKDTGKEYWMTETGAGPAEWEGANKSGKKGDSAGNALDSLGSRIHNAVKLGHASAWFVWLFMRESKFQETALVLADSMDKFEPMKKYYIQKHYAKFIPSGTHCVETSKDAGGVLASAYAEKDKGILTLVLLNQNDSATTIKIKVSGGPSVNSLSAYITDKDKNCEKTDDVAVKGGAIELKMPARCIMTLTTKPE